MEYKISIATKWSQALQDICEQAIQNLPYLETDELPTNVGDLVKQCVGAPIQDAAMFVMSDEKGTPVGVLLGTVINNHPIMQTGQMAHELVFYVSPEHRGKDSFKLVEAYENWARMLGLTKSTMSHFEDEIGSKLEKVYQKMGYKLCERTYVRTL